MKKLFLLPILCLLFSMQGVRYEKRILEGPLCIHILEVDPRFVRIESTHAEPGILSLEKVTDIAKKNNAYAAINGGFFRMHGDYAGTSSGILKIAGEWISSPRLGRAAIGWNRKTQKPLIDRISWKASLKLGNFSIPIDGLNQPANSKNVILYTSSFSLHTLTEKNSLDLQFDQNWKLLAIHREGQTPIPPQGYVLAIGKDRGAFTTEPSVNTYGELFFRIYPLFAPETEETWNNFDDIVNGTPLLVHGGKIIQDFSEEKTLHSFLVEKHPRTAIGIKPDGTWILVVVDGRQPELSLGLTMEELAELMANLGCSSAMNLDGGGSTTFYYDGKILNSPSLSSEDNRILGEERPVSDAILILEKAA
jgi:exopolysaccharide biosynthesis protein